jgi:hypothetical protein
MNFVVVEGITTCIGNRGSRIKLATWLYINRIVRGIALSFLLHRTTLASMAIGPFFLIH